MNVPVINALSDLEHPCQGNGGNLQTIAQHKGQFDGPARSLHRGRQQCSREPCGGAARRWEQTSSSPILRHMGYPARYGTRALERAATSGSSVSHVVDPEGRPFVTPDVVYTDHVGSSMGQEAEKAERVKAFSNYQVNPALMEYAKPDSIFMHDMPAYAGSEISEGMIDHPRSVVFDQAENRLHAQNAVMVALFS